jgi:hypothetical protein
MLQTELYKHLVLLNISKRNAPSNGPLKETHFTIRREAYPRRNLGEFKSLITLKMEATYSSETPILTRATRRNIPKDISSFYRRENIP